MPRRLAATLTILLLVVVALCTGARAADPDDRTVPVTVAATIDAAELTTTGLFTIHLDFTVEEDVGRALSLVVELTERKRVVLAWRHAPTPPTSKWRKGERVRVDLLAPFPTEADAGPWLHVRMAFREDEGGELCLPRGAKWLAEGRVVVAELEVPEFEPVTDDVRVQRILAAADELAKAGRKPDAWAALEFGLRGAPDDATKYRLRDAMLKLGEFAPRPLTEVERRIVEQRIAEERRRFLRQASGRLYDQKKYHGALLILTEVGGKLQEDADAAVIGALNDAKRAEKDLQDLREKIWERCTPEERDEAEKALETLGHGRTVFEKARDWVRQRRYAPARWVLKDLAVTAGEEIATAARLEVRELDRLMLSAVPPDERAAADAALRHPAFDRTAVSLSHQFVFIGPKALVERIPAASRTAFDLSYVFLTDLFGRRPNREGDRVTVYFKELWEFGGGVGGGKIIDIGNARPDAAGTTVDNGLLFHELTHCIDDTAPIHAGFREGLADFGAAYSHEALARPQDAARAFDGAIRAFQRDYVARDLEYWRIPNYGPSAGFLLHFSEKYARGANGHDWSPWRRFFREFRRAPVRDGREPYVMRMFAHHLVAAFGAGAFDDLVTFRFPLVAGDLEAIEKEVRAFAGGREPRPDEAGGFDGFSNSPLVRDLPQQRAIAAMRDGHAEEARRICREELGVQFDWRIIGPFEPEDADPGAQPFPPEHEIDFAKEYPQRLNTARWRQVTDPGPLSIDGLGWVSIRYGYMDHTATYALCHVSVDADVDAHVHVRADDDLTLFVNDARIDGYPGRGWNDSSELWWRGPVEHAADAIRLRVRLHQGRNKLLLKIRNHGGPAGFVLAVAGLDGKPLAGLRADTDAPAPAPPRREPKWRSAARLDFRSKSALQKLDFACGRFDVVNKLAEGTANAKAVGWRKYTVRPGFPKDSPSNLAWLDAKLTDGIEDFRLTFRLAPRKDGAHKLAVTFQGEGGDDGLSGWNVLMWSSGGQVAGQVERYEDRTYQWTPREVVPKDAPEREFDEIVLTYAARRLSVAVNGVPLLTDAPIRPIPGKSRIGFSTWGPDVRIASIELESAR